MKLFYKFLTVVILINSYTTFSQATFTINNSGNWSSTNSWTLSAGTDSDGIPDADDSIIITATTNKTITVDITNAYCLTFKNQTGGTSLPIITIDIPENNFLNVSGTFEVPANVSRFRQTDLIGLGTLNVNGSIIVGNQAVTNSTITSVKTNKLNFNGPNINVDGNINIYNHINTTSSVNYNASSINHTSGKLRLTGYTAATSGSTTGTTGKGYLNTHQNIGGLSADNKYVMSGDATLEFYHVVECPVYITSGRSSEIPPIFNGSTNNIVTYYGNTNRSGASIIYSTTYNKLNIDNSNTNTLSSGSPTIVTNELNIINGSISLGTNAITQRFIQIGNNCKINISSAGDANGLTFTSNLSSRLSYNGLAEINYSGSANKAGLEIKSYNSIDGKGINKLTISGTTNFQLGTVCNENGSTTDLSNLNIKDIISINDNNFTCDMPSITCPSISIDGGISNALTINSNLSSINSTSGVTINGNSITLNGDISATGSSNFVNIIGQTIILNKSISSGNLISINGSTNAGALASINGQTIDIDGDNSSYSGTITAINSNTGLSISGSTTFNADIVASKVTINTNAACVFKETLSGIENLNIYSPCTIEKTQNISNTLTLGNNLTNYNTINTYTLYVEDNSVLNSNGTGVLKVRDLVTIAATKTLYTGDELLLVSNSIGTARVDQVHDTAINGQVIVERFLPNEGRKWRLLTTPLKGNTDNSIYYNWMNNGNESIVGYGTDVWGPSDQYEYYTNGMFYIPESTHNFRKYSNGTWSSVSNSFNEPLFSSTKNNTFLTFIIHPAFQGIDLTDYPTCYSVSNSSPTILSAKGNLLLGQQSYDVSSSTYNLIGNPYASPIDFIDIIDENGVNGNAIDPKIWILDPRMGSFGNYITWDQNVGVSDTKATIYVNENSLIQSGQGFFVKRKSGNTSVPMIINENNKSSGNYNNTFGRTRARTINPNTQRIRVAISKLEDNTDVHKDACVVGFYEGASNAVTGNDVQKFTNAGETLAFVNGNTSLSSEHRLPVANGDVLFIKLTNATTSNYKLKIHTENFAFTGEAVFHDLKLGTSMAMPLDGSIFEYPFDVTSDATTQGTRFKIVFNTTLGIDETVDLIGIKVYPNPSSNSLGVTLNTGNLELGNYEYKILNILGQAVQYGKIENVQINQDIKINFNNAVTSGWYTIQILDKNKIVNSLPIIIK